MFIPTLAHAPDDGYYCTATADLPACRQPGVLYVAGLPEADGFIPGRHPYVGDVICAVHAHTGERSERHRNGPDRTS